METMFLQEVDATIVLADVRDFSPLAQQLGPVDLGLALQRFYEHIGGIIEGHRGRIVKFIGDGVLSVFVGGDHRLAALQAVAELLQAKQQFLDENATRRLPVLDYAIGVASGSVLAGELGTEKLRFYDVLGQPVYQAFRINALATRRAVTNLIAAETWEGVKTPGRRPSAIETDAVELGAEKMRLFKIEG
jgi:adenylate cyclase